MIPHKVLGSNRICDTLYGLTPFILYFASQGKLEGIPSGPKGPYGGILSGQFA